MGAAVLTVYLCFLLFLHSICSIALVAQLCPTLLTPVDYSMPGFSVHGILQAKILEWVPLPSPGIFWTQGLNPGLPHCRQILYHLSHQGSPYGGRREPKPESPTLVYCSASWHVSSPRGGGPTREMGAHYGVILSVGSVDLHTDV